MKNCYLTIAILLLAACDQEQAESFELDEFRSTDDTTDESTDDTGEPVAFWDEVVCTLGETRCYGHRPEADELWSPVVSECDLMAKVDNEGWWTTYNGWVAGCDVGGMPQTFPEIRCFHPGVWTKSVCFGGSDGWFTEVGPSCDIGQYTSSTWMVGSCDPNLDVGYHEYTDVRVQTVSPKLGRAFDGADSFGVAPECKVAGGGAAPDPSAC